MQLLVTTVGREDGTFPQRGDVIHVRKDNEVWGNKEIRIDSFRVIVVPDLSELEAEGLLGSEVGDHTLNPNLHVRDFYLDLDQLDPELFTFRPERTTVVVGVVEVTLDQLRSVVRRKVPRRNGFVASRSNTTVAGK